MIGVRFIDTFDIDGDKDIDIYVQYSQSNMIYSMYFENEGNQIFSKHLFPQRSDYLVDLDLDSDLDIIRAINRNIVWYENDGNQTFVEHIIPSNSGEPRLFFNLVSDVDQDGDIDIFALTITGAGKIYWYENDGNQIFTEHRIQNSTRHVRLSDIIDFDDDGDLDIMAVSDIGMLFFENDGNQNYSEIFLWESTKNNFYTDSIDIDNDGDRDIIATVYDGLSLFINDGKLNFNKQLIFYGYSSASPEITADLDRDGDVDILITNGTDRLVWFTHNLSPTSITLNPVNLLEGQPSGTVMAVLSNNDPDPNDTHTYTLVPGVGSLDNALFSIEGNRLFSNVVLDSETQSSYTIRVRVLDNAASPLGVEQPIAFSISDVMEGELIPTPTPNPTLIKDWELYEIK